MDDLVNTSILVVIAHKTSIDLWRTSVDEDRCTFDLRIDGEHFDSLLFTSFVAPSFSVSPTEVAIFADMRIYVLHLPSRTLTTTRTQEPIHSAYGLESSWCLVCETGVTFLDRNQQQITPRWEHDEIIIRSWWIGGDLYIKDLRERRYRFADACPERQVVAQPL